jgi:hypothetical protein
METPAGKRADALKQSPEPRFCGRDAEEDQNNDDDGNAEQKPCAPLAPLSTRRIAIVFRHNGGRLHKGNANKTGRLPLGAPAPTFLPAFPKVLESEAEPTAGSLACEHWDCSGKKICTPFRVRAAKTPPSVTSAAGFCAFKSGGSGGRARRTSSPSASPAGRALTDSRPVDEMKKYHPYWLCRGNG